MTKLKNTKKGMAKKALSISLVAAMLATSNVPVWAAEDLFTDGSTAVETQAIEDTDVFTEAPAEDVAPAAEETENNEISLQAESSSNAYTAEVSFSGADANNSIVWGNSLGVTNYSIKDADGNTPSNVYYAWKVNGLADNESSIPSSGIPAYPTTAADAGKKVSLFLIVKDSKDQVAWTYTSDEITVKAKDISSVVEINNADFITEADKMVYNGKEQKLPIKDVLVNVSDSSAANMDDYKVAYSGDLVNVTDKGVTVTITSNVAGYNGEITCNYKISPKSLGTDADVAGVMEATLTNTSYAYTGNAITKVKKSDIKLIDKETKEDISGYLNADKDGFVTVDTISAADAAVGKKATLNVSLITGTAESGLKNYKLAAGLEATTENQLTVVARDLSTVTATITPQTYTGKLITIASSAVTFTDKTTNEPLTLGTDIKVNVPTNAIERGNYTASIVPADNNKNVTGTVSANFSIYSSSIENAKFENESNLPAKYYTGEQVTFTSEELGALRILKDGSTTEWVTMSPDDYEITYGANINAGTGKGSIIVKGKNSYAGSVKTITFDIAAASLSSIKANDYVELINTNVPKDYKDSMGVTVKAKNGANKEFTLVEGTDYTVVYSFDDANAVGKNVAAVVTITNPNFAGSSTITNPTVKSEITAAALKAEYIKFKENSFTYTGKPVEPEFDVVIDGKVINPDLYTKTFTNNINAGTATLSITGKGGAYSDKASAQVTFTINPVDVSQLNAIVGSQEYKGYSLTIPADEIDATLNGSKVNVADNFTLTFGENIQIGEGTVTLTPKNGNFTGTKTITFQIIGSMLNGIGSFVYYNNNGIKIQDKDSVFTYDGTAHTFGKVVFTFKDTNNKTVTLTEGTDFDLVYADNIYGKTQSGVQKGAVLAIAKGKYGSNSDSNGLAKGIYTDAEGNKTANVIAVDYFTISQVAVAKSNVSVSNAVYAGGLPVKPEVSIIVNGVKLVEGKDFDLDLTANKDIVNATATKSLNVTVKPKNGYTGSNLDLDWGIDKFNLANADVTVQDGKLVVKCGRVDIEASEYTTTVNNDGTTTITAVSTSKNYTGSKTVNSNGQTDAEKPAAPVITDVKVAGNKATVILSGESDGATGYDYVISTDRNCITNKDYDKVNKNILTPQTAFTYTQQGTYYAYCHSWKRVNGVKVFSDWSNAYPFVVSSITPDQPVVTKVAVSGSTVKVTYTKSANATGYDVVLGSAVKKVNGESRPVEYGKLVKKVTKGSTVTATFTNVPKGTYYAGLHAYNRTSENGTKVFSNWSNTKKAIVK